MTDIDNHHIKTYLKHVKSRERFSQGTYETRKNGLKRFNEWLNANDLAIDEVDPFDIEDFLFDLAEGGYAPNTVSSYWDSTRLLYQFLTKRTDSLEENPVEEVKYRDIKPAMKGTKKHDKAEVSYVDQDEVEQLIQNVPRPKLRNRLLIRLLYQSGARAHELASVELDDIDREQRTIDLWSEKTSSGRTVCFQSSAAALLSQWLDGGHRASVKKAKQSPYLFPTRHAEKIRPQTISKTIVEAAKRADLQEVLYTDANGNPRYRITAHTIRHGTAMKLNDEGVDLKRIMEYLGHDTPQQTGRPHAVPHGDRGDGRPIGGRDSRLSPILSVPDRGEERSLPRVRGSYSGVLRPA